jgi:hypothetical protein
MDWGNLFTGIVAGLVGLGGGFWARRSAKESNVSQLYSGLTTNQGAELKRLSDRVELLDKDRDDAKQMAREHVKWDWEIVRKLRRVLPDEEFPDPPPLDT